LDEKPGAALPVRGAGSQALKILMDERTTGLILRTRPLTETSLIVQWLTPDLGRIATVAKGARRAKSPFQGKLDLFYLADLSFNRSRRSDLHTLREVSVREFNAVLRRELGYLQQAAYFAQLIELTTETETPLPRPFQLLVEALAVLPSRPPQPVTVFAFEMKLLEELGLAPRLDEIRMSPGAREILEKIARADWVTLSRIKPSDSQTTEMASFLNSFWQQHLPKPPRGRASALSCP
jgi:DNA repair protein RecO (recombination protein O)